MHTAALERGIAVLLQLAVSWHSAWPALTAWHEVGIRSQHQPSAQGPSLVVGCPAVAPPWGAPDGAARCCPRTIRLSTAYYQTVRPRDQDEKNTTSLVTEFLRAHHKIQCGVIKQIKHAVLACGENTVLHGLDEYSVLVSLRVGAIFVTTSEIV